MSTERSTKIVRVPQRAHEIAEGIHGDLSIAQTVALALEVLDLIYSELGQFADARRDPGPMTARAHELLREHRQRFGDWRLHRLAQALEIFGMASATKWPDGSTGIRGLVQWLDGDEPTSAERLHALGRGDAILSVLRRVHRDEASE